LHSCVCYALQQGMQRRLFECLLGALQQRFGCDCDFDPRTKFCTNLIKFNFLFIYNSTRMVPSAQALFFSTISQMECLTAMRLQLADYSTQSIPPHTYFLHILPILSIIRSWSINRSPRQGGTGNTVLVDKPVPPSSPTPSRYREGG